MSLNKLGVELLWRSGVRPHSEMRGLDVVLELVPPARRVRAEVALEGLVDGVDRVHVPLQLVLAPEGQRAEVAVERLFAQMHGPDVAPHAVLLVAEVVAEAALVRHRKRVQVDRGRRNGQGRLNMSEYKG